MRESILSYLTRSRGEDSEIAVAAKSGLRTLRWSYGRLIETAAAVALELERLGIGKGDRVILWAPNGPPWLAAFFGCVMRRAVVVPLDTQTTPDFARRVQQQVEAGLLIGSAEISESLRELPLLDINRILELPGSEVQPNLPGVSPDEPLEIIFTSGTTAEPRGVVITHRNLISNLDPIETEIDRYIKWERLVHPIRFLSLVPLSHVFGQFMGIFIPPLLGGEIHFQESMNPTEIITTAKRERISVIVAVPRQIETLRDKIERDQREKGVHDRFLKKHRAAENAHFLRRWWMFRDIRSQFGWKFWAFVSGGATLAPETETFWQRLGYALVQGYGMTETASIISVNHPFKQSRGSIGKMLPGMEVKLDEKGEILVRGANVSPGYWAKQLEPLRDAEGWLRTGDLGEMDAEGNLYFKGRKKEVIVTGAGLNVHPEDLEAELNVQPGVRECAVISVEKGRGPEPLAVLILDRKDVDPETVVSGANRALGPHQQIRHWRLWPDRDFPRTRTTRKVLKRVIAESISEEHDGEVSAPSTGSALEEIVAMAGGRTEDGLGEEAALGRDLRLDSLARVELASAIEDRYQVEIDEAAFSEATTIAEVRKIIAGDVTGVRRIDSYPAWTQHFPTTWIRLLVYYVLVYPINQLMCRVKAKGVDRLKGQGGPMLFASNHVSMVDHGLILSALPPRYRHRIAVAMEGERLRGWRNAPKGVGLLGRLGRRLLYYLVVALFNVFPLPRKSGFRRSFAFAGESVDRGYSVLIFPEGRMTEDGKLNDFLSGVGMLASELGIPVVPVRIDGLFELKQRRQYFSRPGSVTITFGEPIEYGGHDSPTIASDLRSRMERL